jgi:hypothetical protein
VDWLHDIHHYACQHLKVCYDCPASYTGFQEGDEVWLYHLIQTRGSSSKLQPANTGLYKVITHTSDMAYNTQ